MKRTSYVRAMWVLLGLMSLCIAGCAAPAPETPSVTPSAETEGISQGQRHQALARQHVKNGNYEEAVKQYKKGLGMEPGSISMRRELADVYVKLADRKKQSLKAQGISPDGHPEVIQYYDDAVKVYDDALKQSEGRPPELMKGRAWVLAATGRYEESIAQYEEVLASDPNDASVYVSLGYTYNQMGDVDAAGAAYAKAVELNPKDRETVMRLALMYHRARRAEDAKHWYEIAYELDPMDAQTAEYLADMYIAANEYGKALPVYRELVEIDPENYKYQVNYGAALQNEADKILEDPEKALKAARQTFFNLEKQFNEGKVMGGVVDDAEVQMERAEAAHDMALAKWRVAVEPALNAYLEAIRLNPDKVQVRWRIGDLLTKMDRFAEADEMINAGLDANSNDAYGWYMLGKLREKEERYDDAIRAFNEAAGLNDERVSGIAEKEAVRMAQIKEREERIRARDQFYVD